ncbi:SDR family NAD(P)-dependent oxidoreductase [Streptomyces antimycoticus]|uniref:Glucose 1-dehydrogenase n=1 Tax=Streptomyces mordarskii TaxID=1226758 RepID=A0ABN1DNY2_9ACTN|nr:MULTISPECIES: SDR family NAD(P)-dependent oxidoreductase [Streptomyces]RSS47529.1 SDR family oxidoreductase [Streptomyces sp. WAC05858]WJE01210.1 SDR family NAD(P)-dependent oxidoreductase [Streptomyces antimycoticus]WTA79562.1 SDR family oxidoreductase [Streptomyces antimycoticus]WTB10257.1 SDR family oxidoreductase [Streptomyces antimycoticus]
MLERFTGKTVIVFGAGSAGQGWGNGKAAAVAYAREGATVIAVDLRKQAAIETAEVIAAEEGRAEAWEADITSDSEVAHIVAEVMAAHGRIDVLHNNVGVTQMGRLETLTPQQWDRSLDVNLSGVFRTMKAVLPGMVERGTGAIVNVSSLAGMRYTGYPYPAYSAAKAAVNHLTAVTALEYARTGVRINAVAPGLVETPLIFEQISSEYSSTEEMLAARHAASPTGRMGTAWDVAHAALFLASDQAAYVTGVTIPVDGGLHVRCL